MKRTTLSQLPILSPSESSSSSCAGTPSICVRSSFAPRRGAAMLPVYARASRHMRNFLKRGRVPVLRTAFVGFIVLIAAACASGRLGLIVTPDTLTLRLARTPPPRTSHVVRTMFHHRDHHEPADAALNDNDADADDVGDDAFPHHGTASKAHSRSAKSGTKSAAGTAHHAGGTHSTDAAYAGRASHAADKSQNAKDALHDEFADSVHSGDPVTNSPAANSGQTSSTTKVATATSLVIKSPAYDAPRRLPNGKSNELTVPDECSEWRSLAQDPTRLRLYRLHFTSLDFTDWFVFVSMFTEAWHRQRLGRSRRPVYIDVAANHARRWSNTYFLDRCMGWDGVCAEANAVYHEELRRERHCAIIDTCVSDRPRAVNFSFAAAYGGVVRGANNRDWGVDGGSHATRAKYAAHFRGFRTLTCTTLTRELPRLGISRVDFMSLDVEGHELPVLMGIDWLHTKIDVLVVENKRKEVVTFITARGFDRYRGVLKDDIYIRKGSGYAVDPKFADWLQTLSKTDHKFHLPGNSDS